jgi:hypothetical protein
MGRRTKNSRRTRRLAAKLLTRVALAFVSRLNFPTRYALAFVSRLNERLRRFFAVTPYASRATLCAVPAVPAVPVVVPAVAVSFLRPTTYDLRPSFRIYWTKMAPKADILPIREGSPAKAKGFVVASVMLRARER